MKLKIKENRKNDPVEVEFFIETNWAESAIGLYAHIIGGRCDGFEAFVLRINSNGTISREKFYEKNCVTEELKKAGMRFDKDGRWALYED